ncbi:MAG: L,D-transpeptidase family protein, partial [Verrucomicrobia bacterium]|nr:L,D-transpeptidase family protein [Verrucomicrobiota bacterium]
NLTLIQEALAGGADPDQTVQIGPERLITLGAIKPRLAHYFAEETKATPLILAAAMDNAEACKLLLSFGAKRYLPSKWGWVPAQYAAHIADPELAQLLFDSDPAATHYSIRISLSSQRVFLFRDGVSLVEGRISTGRPGFDTPKGHYLVTDKERVRRSSLYKVPMPYFLRLSFGEYGIHQGVNPGRPASHGCIRIGKASVAKTVYENTPIGTLVLIE